MPGRLSISSASAMLPLPFRYKAGKKSSRAQMWLRHGRPRCVDHRQLPHGGIKHHHVISADIEMRVRKSTGGCPDVNGAAEAMLSTIFQPFSDSRGGSMDSESARVACMTRLMFFQCDLSEDQIPSCAQFVSCRQR